mgnify:CR=1 FL=1
MRGAWLKGKRSRAGGGLVWLGQLLPNWRRTARAVSRPPKYLSQRTLTSYSLFMILFLPSSVYAGKNLLKAGESEQATGLASAKLRLQDTNIHMAREGISEWAKCSGQRPVRRNCQQIRPVLCALGPTDIATRVRRVYLV